jgi:phenylpropionate dioxygenase-like ring-hydroxylating dioxygenase large terminal subunit
MAFDGLSSHLSMDNLVDNRDGTIKPAVFSHPAIYERELEQIFTRSWLFVGHESQIANAGDFVRSRMGEEQVIVTRGRDNQIYVLLNSCPHRGNMVCRYDRGHGLAFQCSFHGWTFDGTGRLINLPPGMEDEYAADLKKDAWGMLRARVATFHGTIWANWDETAPSFADYLGGAAAYLEAALADCEGDPDGTELAGAVMKWRVGINWKVPMPDHDVAHGWITHRSTRGGSLRLGGDGGGASSSQGREDYHVWFPEGHTTSVFLREEGMGIVGDGALGPNSAFREYRRERAATRRERLAKMAPIDEIPHIFPNVGAVAYLIRVMHPQGPTETEMWSYMLVDKAAPPEVKEELVRFHERRWGPNGVVQKDDMENWYIQTRYSKGFSTRWRLRQNNQLGMSRPSLDGPSTFGMPGLFHRWPTDENYRRFFEHWALVMEANSWDEILAKEAMKVRAPGKVAAAV